MEKRPLMWGSRIDPALGDIVIMDNLGSHKGPDVHAAMKRQAPHCAISPTPQP